MKLSLTPNLTFTRRRSCRGVSSQVEQQGYEVEAAIEPAGKRADVLSVCELEGLVRTIDHRLEIGRHGVDPRELRQVARLALTHDDVGVNASCVDYTGRAPQAIAAHVAAGQQIGLGPTGDGFTREAGYRRELDTHRFAGIVGLHGRNDGYLVGRAATTDASVTLASQISVVEFHAAAQWLLAVTPSHGRYELVVNQPSGAVAGAQLAHKCQRRQSGLVLTDQEDSQKPSAQRQVGAVHYHTRCQRGLVPTGSALEEFARPVANRIVRRTRAAGATQSAGPAQFRHRRLALCLDVIAVEELGQRYARLKLDSVHRHGWLSTVDGSQRTGLGAYGVSPAELRDESGKVLINLSALVVFAVRVFEFELQIKYS